MNSREVFFFNKFNVLYIDGKVLNLHAELSYNVTEKFTAALRFDQYNTYFFRYFPASFSKK